MEAFPNASDELIDELAVESFLTGCKFKEAAVAVSDRTPSTLDEAYRFVKNTIHSRKAILNRGKIIGKKLKKMKETLSDSDSDSDEKEEKVEKKVRSVTYGKKFQNNSPSKPKADGLEELVKKMMVQLTSLQKSVDSKTPPRNQKMACFDCQEVGHFRGDPACKNPKSPRPRQTSPYNSPQRWQQTGNRFDNSNYRSPRDSRWQPSGSRSDNTNWRQNPGPGNFNGRSNANRVNRSTSPVADSSVPKPLNS